GIAKKPPKDKALAKVEQELQYTKENLQTTIEELETSNEELKSTNEELQSTNEELQSTNEELETSKEELQSLNEESATVNAELQSRIDELSATTDDMKNLLDSTQIATIFLDTDFCIRRFTPTVTQLIPLSNSDVGRPVDHFATQLKDVKLSDAANKVLNDLVIREDEVITHDGRMFRLKTLPYRTVQNVIDGVVLTFEDITEQKQIELKQKTNEEQLRTIIESTEDIIALVDLDGKYLHYSGSDKYGLVPEKVVGKTVFEILGDETGKMVFKQIKAVAKTDKSQYDETTLNWHGKMIYFEDFRYPVKDNKGRIIAVGTIGRNITKRKVAELMLEKTESRYKLALKNLPIIVAEFDLDLRYTWIYNPHPDFDVDSVLGKRDDDLDQNEGTTALVKMKKEVIKTGKTKRNKMTFSLSNQDHEYDIVIQPTFDIDGKIIGGTSAAFDITNES
ncbi:MAG: PAS domain-containing protein, partial [Desulfobacteraceae bacterium]|nr:PAS domain-containing protein [Desulfobacteraceae bacterium]